MSDDNKATQRRALEKLRKETVGHGPPFPPVLLQEVFDGLLKPLLKVYSAPSERCRELAINLVAEWVFMEGRGRSNYSLITGAGLPIILGCFTRFMEVVESPTHFLPLIIPVVVSRLGCQEITEPSEELR